MFDNHVDSNHVYEKMSGDFRSTNCKAAVLVLVHNDFLGRLRSNLTGSRTVP